MSVWGNLSVTMSPSESSKVSSEQSDFVNDWLVQLRQCRFRYKEPILDQQTVLLMKNMCLSFEQATNVFIKSLEVLEDYVLAKNAARHKISDPLLAVAVTVFICHKYEGAEEALKLKHVCDVLFHFSKKHYDPDLVISMENDILYTLDGRIPVTSPLDDLDVILERCMREKHLRINIRPLCLKMLELMYVYKSKWFYDIKKIYSNNAKSRGVFSKLVRSKFYIPVGVLFSALWMTACRQIMDPEQVLELIKKHTKIHNDHFKVLATKIMELINNDQ